MKRRYVALIILCIIITANTPYFFGIFHRETGLLFSGFINNPIDGNSYLAKMQEGFLGSWKFYLPYSYEATPSSYLFLFYIFLGHVSRWVGVPLILIFHFARLLSSVFLFSSLWYLSELIFTDPKDSVKAFLLASFGSGMGWILLPWSIISADFWVTEAYPFLSSVTNPHFPLGLACMVWLLILYMAPNVWCRLLKLFVLSSALAIIMPFGVVIIVLIIVMDVLLRRILKEKVPYITAACIALPGGILISAQYIQTMSDPFLRLWNIQNQTPSPALWDLLISLSPALLVAIWAILKKPKQFGNQLLSLLTSWLVITLFLMYLPLNIQRRFMLGMYIPIAFLCVFGLTSISVSVRKRNIAWIIVILISALTNIATMFGNTVNVTKENPLLFVTLDEKKTYDWISKNIPKDGIFLASPETGNNIPAYTGRRVVYGHPFETIDADKRKSESISFFSEGLTKSQVNDYINKRQVDYVFWGPREKKLGNQPDLSELSVIFKNETISVLTTKNE